AAAGHRAATLEDEVRTAWLRVSPGHPVDFRIVDRETVAAGAELGHHRADDGGHAGIVPGLDRADCPVSAGHAVSGTMVARARCSANAAARRPGANRKPWPTGTPSFSRKRRCASVSTPSAMRPSPRLVAIPDTARQTATSDWLSGTPCRKRWLSLSPWIGSRRR